MSFHDEELARLLETSGVSQGDIRRAEVRATELKQREAQTVYEGVARVTLRLAERADEIIESTQMLYQQVAEIEGQLLKHEATGVDAQKILANSRQKLRELSKVTLDLRTQKAQQDAIFADPNAEADRLFQTYPSLQSSRKSIFD